MASSARVTLVVPCYNEASRLQPDAFVGFAQKHPEVRLTFVDDGSTDDTLARLREIATAAGKQVSVLHHAPNRGKAEAVRTGMLVACDSGIELAGYWDADLATPLEELPRFVRTLDELPEREIVFGARVQLLGRTIQRSAPRHYLGREFATAASLLLGLPVYDTQCGAKLFRVSPDVRALFAEPFVVGWTFDVEIIARLARLRRDTGGPGPRDVIYELPLRTWRDVEGSKVRPADFARAMAELWRVYRRYLRAGAPPFPTP